MLAVVAPDGRYLPEADLRTDTDSDTKQKLQLVKAARYAYCAPFHRIFGTALALFTITATVTTFLFKGTISLTCIFFTKRAYIYNVHTYAYMHSKLYSGHTPQNVWSTTHFPVNPKPA